MSKETIGYSGGALYRFRWKRMGLLLLTGLGLHAFFFRWTFHPHELLVTLAVTLVYGLGMWGTMTTTGMLLARHISLNSRNAFMLHAAAQTTVMVATFLLLSWGIGAATGLAFMNSGGTMMIIGLVALCGSLLGNGIYYMALFYRRMREAENAALRAELGTLRAQINPHFLFNSLNSIAALIRTDPPEAEAMVESLADLFRYSLRSSAHPTVPLFEEMASIELYLRVEKARFRERLHVHIDIPQTLHDARVPSLLLQPLVENAVKHAAGAMLSPCEIVLSAARDGEHLRVRISDNGPGFPSTDIQDLLGRGTGLANVRERLRLQFGAGATMLIETNALELRFPCTAQDASSASMIRDYSYNRP